MVAGADEMCSVSFHKFDPFLLIILQLLDADRSMPAKQQYMAERVHRH